MEAVRPLSTLTCDWFGVAPSQEIKAVHLTNNKLSNVFKPQQKLSVETVPHSVTSLCFYYPRLCMKPEEAQFVRLSDENGRPLLLITPAEGTSPQSLVKNKKRLSGKKEF